MVAATSLVVSVAATSAAAQCRGLLPPGRVAPTAARPLTADDLLGMRIVGPPDGSSALAPSPLALSPDGRQLAFVISREEPSTGGYAQALLLQTIGAANGPRTLDCGGDRIFQNLSLRGSRISAGWPAVVTPRWSPDGAAIAYLKRLNGVSRLWVAYPDGRPAVAVSPADIDVVDWRWRADSRALVYSVEPGRRAEAAAIAREGRVGYLYDARIWPGDGNGPLPAGDLPRAIFVTYLTGHVTLATADATADFIRASDNNVQTDRRGWTAATVADGRSPLSPTHLVVTPPGRAPISCTVDACRDGLVGFWWLGDDILYLRRGGWNQEDMALYRWHPGARAPRRILRTHDVLLGCVLAVRLACTAEASNVPRRIVTIDVKSGRVTTVFEPNPELAGIAFGAVRRLRLRNQFGLEGWADLVTPPNAPAGKRLPTIIVQYHSRGFLRGGTGDDYPIFLFAARGYAVLSLEQPRNVAFARPDLKDWDAINAYSSGRWRERQSLYSSLDAAIDAGIAAGVVDPTRIGITGLSDGASTVQYALIHSRRFAAAAISTCCIEPKTVMTQGIGWADWNRKVQGFPPASRDDPAFWQPLSLSVNASRIDVPILMQLADSEYLQSLEAFTALRENGKPVEMYVFPDEYHNKVSPVHRRAVWVRALDWFDFWLRQRIDPDPDKAAQYRRWRRMRPIG